MIRILALVLLLPSVGWAEELKSNRQFEIRNELAFPLLTCDERYENCRGPLVEHSPCYQQMREALRVIDKAGAVMVYRDPVDGIGTEVRVTLNPTQWKIIRNTIKDCVEDKP